MTKTIFIKLALFLACISFINTGFKKYDCSDFKTGEYVVKSKENTTYISRKGDHQIEYTPSNKVKIKSMITLTS